jgi:uncharacterized protein YbcI
MKTPTGQPGPAEDQLERGPLAAVAGVVAGLIREHWGRGPARSRAYWSGADALVMLLDDTHTPAERSLREGGRSAEVLAIRRQLFAVTEKQLRGAVGSATGRPVRACLFDAQLDPDVSALVFLLGPAPSGEPLGQGLAEELRDATERARG